MEPFCRCRLTWPGATRRRRTATSFSDCVPEVFRQDETPDADNGQARIAPRIGVVEPLGSDTLFFFDLAGTEVVARMPPLVGPKRGDKLPLIVDMGKMHLFDAATEQVV